MKSVLYFFVRLNIVAALIFSSIAAFSEPSSGASGIERLRIDFISVPDWIEIKRIEEEPEKLVVRLVRKDGVVIPIATFNQDGLPTRNWLALSRIQPVGGVLFAIVKWRYYLSGVDAEGDCYEVHACETQKK
ncbi:hypothetical protein WN982_39465 [Paraburkholderia sp. IMGN_8]|uniref:hypothetical protein n=1 Tax=Paraburkholderia sp. IMGN_8 TaxID=3136564 RepID=UPI003101A1CE